jgi:hypothetical protein
MQRCRLPAKRQIRRIWPESGVRATQGHKLIKSLVSVAGKAVTALTINHAGA